MYRSLVISTHKKVEVQKSKVTGLIRGRVGTKTQVSKLSVKMGMEVKVKYCVHNLLRKPAAGAKGEARAVGWGNREGRDLLWL